MNEEAWHRRHAIQVVCCLPEDYEDAVAVLRAAERLIHEYVRGPDKPSGSVRNLREVKS